MNSRRDLSYKERCVREQEILLRTRIWRLKEKHKKKRREKKNGKDFVCFSGSEKTMICRGRRQRNSLLKSFTPPEGFFQEEVMCCREAKWVIIGFTRLHKGGTVDSKVEKNLVTFETPADRLSPNMPVHKSRTLKRRKYVHIYLNCIFEYVYISVY